MARRSGRLREGKGWALGRPSVATAPPSPRPGGRPVIRLRMERRNGRPVTVLAAEGIPEEALRALLGEMKGMLAAGGTCRGSEAEIQGEHRERLREWLQERGYRVKG